jgi:transmembrane sensor
MTRGDQLDDPRAEIAIGRMVEMNSGEMSERKYRSFEAWLQADPRNETVWVRLQEGLMPCGVATRHGMNRGVLTERLLKKQQNRRTFLTSLAGVVGLGTVGFSAANRFLPLNYVLADHFTLTAQQERVTLADGSEIMLAPRSAIDLRYREGLRAVHLLDGQAMVRVAARAAPFELSAGGVDLWAASGTFLVEKQDDVLSLSGIEGRAHVGRGGNADYGLNRGDQLVFAGSQVRRQSADLEASTAWVDGLLVAKDRTVASIVDGLRPYFPGVIRVDAAAATVRATGVFSLKNPNDALDALASSLGLSVTRIARYWVEIGPRAT